MESKQGVFYPLFLWIDYYGNECPGGAVAETVGCTI